jgi:hypothetical protein
MHNANSLNPLLTQSPPNPMLFLLVFLALIFTDSLLAQECTSLSEFESPLVEVDGELKSNALLFDITALQSMEITSLDIRFENSFRDNEYLVSIYTKPGTYQGFESDSSAWTESFFGRISVPSQQTSVTTLPEAAFRSIPVDAGSQQAFYVYLRSTRSTPMISIPGSREGDVAFLDGDKYLIIHQGATTSPNFEAPTATRSPMMFLGRLHYNACTLDDSTVDGLCTGENATLSTLTTRLNGAGKSKGILFDVQAKSDTTILSMDLHLEQLPSEDSCVVSVYYRPDVSTGGMVGDLMAYGDWTPLFSGAVKYGASRIVRLDPEQFTPVNLVEGDKFAFYVLVNDADKSPIVSSSSVDGDSPFATSCSLDILPGKTSDAPFNVPVSASPVGFNGVLRYSACPNENCDEDSTGGGECPTIEENPRTDIMMIVKPDTEIIRVSENKRDLRTGGSCYLAEGTRTDDCLVASYKEPCSYDGYRVQTADKRSTFVIQEDTVIFCNRTRHEKEWYVRCAVSII